MAKDAIPAIPAVPTNIKDKQLRNHLQAIRDTLQTRAGQTKNRLDYSPTVRELQDAGILTVRGSGLDGDAVLQPPAPGRPPPWDYPTIPLAPTGVVVFATPWFHHVTWDLTTEPNHYISSHGEVWCNTINDRTGAWLAGIGMIAFSNPVEPLAHRFYWVRYISHANVQGHWSNDIYDGVEAISPPDPDTLREVLSGAITESELYGILNDRLDHYGVVVAKSENSFTVKINNDGHIAGFGLIVDGDADYNPLLGHSQFGVSADTFWIGAPGATDFAFIVDTQNNRVVMDGAFISQGTITSAAIGTAAIDTAHIGDLTITAAKIQDGVIENAKIGNIIRSYNYDPANGIGWQLLKSGALTCSEIVIYNSQGEVILASGPSGTAYHADIDNSAVLFANISDIPDHLEYAALLSMPAGGYGDMQLTHDIASGVAVVSGARFFLPDGTRYSVEAGKYVEIFQRAGVTYKAGFIVYFAQILHNRFPGWNASNIWSTHFALCFFDSTTDVWVALDSTGVQYIFVPADTNCIIATTSRNNPDGSDATFNSLIGVNSAMPDDNATVTGHDNLVVDGDFNGVGLEMQSQGFANGENIQGKNSWWDVRAGENYVSWHLYEGYGHLLQLRQTPENVIIYGNNKIPVVVGEPLFLGLRIYVGNIVGDSVDNPYFSYSLSYFDINDNWLSVDLAINIPINGYSYFNFLTGVSIAPPASFYAQVRIEMNRTDIRFINLSFIGCSRAPLRIGPEEARTYIKDAAIDTLQLAGNTVFVTEVTERATSLNWNSQVFGQQIWQVYPGSTQTLSISSMTSTSVFLARVELQGNYFNSGGAAGVTSTGTGEWRMRIQMSVGGGSWFAIREVVMSFPPTSSRLADGGPQGSDPRLYDVTSNALQSFSATYRPGAMSNTQFQFRVNYYETLYQSTGRDTMNLVFTVQAAKR